MINYRDFLKEFKSDYKSQYLELLENNEFDFLVGDIEAYLDEDKQFIFKLGVLFDGREFFVSKTIDEFVKDLKYFKDYEIKKYVYFHNLDFDLLFFIKENVFQKGEFINSGNLIISFLNDVIEFRNSLTILPMSLKKVVKDFLKIDYPLWENQKNDIFSLNDEELITYCARDTFLTFLGVSKLKNFMKQNYDIKDFLTIPSLAIKIFKKEYVEKNEEIKKIFSNRRKNFFNENFYTGGHTEKFINYKYYFENLNYYDVNSLYPYVMKNLKINNSRFIVVKPTLKNLYKLIYEKKIFYVDIELKITKEEGRVIPINFEQKNYYPKGVIRAKVSNTTINYLREIKDLNIIKIHTIITHLDNKEVCLFKEYVDTFYKLRKEDKANNVIYKLLLNSLYGKFGQKDVVNKIYLNQDSEDLYQDFDTFRILGNNILQQREELLNYTPFYFRKDIAGLVTENARILMSRYRLKLRKFGIKTYYQDTDSLIINSDLEKYYELKELVDAKKLGKLKKENNEVLNGYIIGQKFYYFNIDKKASKGVKKIYKNQYRCLAYALIIQNCDKIKWVYFKKCELQIDLTLYPNKLFFNERFTKIKTYFKDAFFGIKKVPFEVLEIRERLDKLPLNYYITNIKSGYLSKF